MRGTQQGVLEDVWGISSLCQEVAVGTPVGTTPASRAAALNTLLGHGSFLEKEIEPPQDLQCMAPVPHVDQTSV